MKILKQLLKDVIHQIWDLSHYFFNIACNIISYGLVFYTMVNIYLYFFPIDPDFNLNIVSHVIIVDENDESVIDKK